MAVGTVLEVESAAASCLVRCKCGLIMEASWLLEGSYVHDIN